ncbi:MAG: C39 family peptidase, partial [bacterium]
MKRIIAAIAACLLLWPLFAQADKVLSVPYIHQTLDVPTDFQDGKKACGATSLAMILAYYGKISEPYGDHVPEIHEFVYIQGKGASWDKIIEYATRYEISGWKDFSPDINEIKNEINLNYPIILSTRLLDKEGHMMVAIGYTDTDEIIVANDPAGYYYSYEYDGAKVKYTFKELKLKGYITLHPPEPITPVVDWPSHQKDPQNTGNNFCAGTIRNPKLDDKPMTIEGTSAYSQPIVEGHMVYLALTDGRVVASDMERKLCPWFFNTGAPEIKLTPALVGNKLYVLDSNNVLWVLNKKTGQVLGNCDIGLDYYWQTSPQVWQNYIVFTI